MVRTIYIAALFFIAFSSHLFSQQKDSVLITKDSLIANPKDSLGTEEIETEEVVVTGTRTYKKIIDIPYSVFRIETREIKYGRNVNAKDVLADVPGLFLQARYGNDVRISIRGFGTRSNTGVRGIRILQDGVPESDPDGETSIDAIDFTSLGGVEVVKGNLSSLYTNSPGGVINFLSDINFQQNFVKLNNEIGDFGLRMNGLKFGLHSSKARFFISYNYRNYKGFRQHSTEFVNLANGYFQVYPDNHSSVSILGNFVRGFQRLPGSLTREEFDANPFQPYFIAVSSDFKRITKKGRLAVRYNNLWGKDNSNELELTGYGAIKDIDFTTNTLYNIVNKYTLGSTIRYVNKTPLFKRNNEFSTGFDYFFLNGPIFAFNNIAGIKGDDLQSQHLESLGNMGFYFQDQFNIIKERTDILFSGRYDKLIYNNDNQLFEQQSSERKFDRFTPKIALNFKLGKFVALYSSFGFGFDTPSQAELENYPFSSNQGATTLNPDINPQRSKNFEFGIKGNILGEELKKKKMKGSKEKENNIFEKLYFEFTFFDTRVEDEIVPFIVSDKAYFRNAAQTNRAGVECGVKFEGLRGLEVVTNYTYTHFRYKNYISRSYDPSGNFVDENFDGNTVPAVPKHLVNFIANYQWKLGENVKGLLLFDCDYVSKMFTDDKNTESTSPYLYANTLVGVDYTLKNFNVLLSGGVNNFLNRQYVGFISVNANPELPEGQRRYYEPGEPRTYYVNLNLAYRF